MSVTSYWNPNQTAQAQVETYTFTAPNAVGNTYNATINGKTVTYASVSGDTAATVATAMFSLLNTQTNVPPELTEITFTNPSDGVIVATASTPGVPFANVTIDGVTGQGLVMSTGNGLSNGITTAHTKPNKSPSDVTDPQNWVRANLATTPPALTRAIPQTGDDVVVSGTSVPMLWNLDGLATVQFNTYTRWQSMSGAIGLPPDNAGGYAEWRACNFKFSGPTGSAPAGGLPILLGYGPGSGPSLERYDMQSSRYTCRAVGAGSPSGQYGIYLYGYHTDNVIVAENGVSVAVAIAPGETAKLNSVTTDGNSTVAIGAGVTWATNIFGTAASCVAYGGTLVLNSQPPTLSLNNGAQATFPTDGLTWPSITAQGGCNLTWLAGGVITSLVMTNGCNFDKSQDARGLVITNSTIDGDTCQIIDPLNAITYTNATTVKQQVSSGPFVFTGTRTVKVV